MSYLTTVDPFVDHLDLVRAVTGAGIEPPQEWTETLERFDAYNALHFPIRQRLADAVTNSTDDADIALLKAAAAGEEIGQAGNQTNMVVQRQVLRRLREIYSTVAADNYAAVAAQFDKAAKQFTDLAATCDVKADAATIIDKPDKVRRAFLDAESHANAINRLLPALAAAATLARGFDTMPQQTQDGAMVTVSKHGDRGGGPRGRFGRRNPGIAALRAQRFRWSGRCWRGLAGWNPANLTRSWQGVAAPANCTHEGLRR